MPRWPHKAKWAYEQKARSPTSTALRGTAGGLGEFVAELGGVGHGKTGAIHEKDVVAMPAVLRPQHVVAQAAAGDGVLQSLEESEGKATACLTVGGAGKSKPTRRGGHTTGAIPPVSVVR